MNFRFIEKREKKIRKWTKMKKAKINFTFSIGEIIKSVYSLNNRDSFFY